jgi:hypothetical protein
LEQFIEDHRANADDSLCTLALRVLGTKPFVGSLTLSLYQIVAENAGEKSNEIKWPRTFPVSALNYVDRFCKHATKIGEDAFDVGTRVRCCTQETTYSTDQKSFFLFGLGIHTCLGKGISEFSWKVLIQHLSQLSVSLVPFGSEMDTHTEPFSMPSVARIAVR